MPHTSLHTLRMPPRDEQGGISMSKTAETCLGQSGGDTVTNSGNYMLNWDSSQSVPLQLNSAMSSSPILVPNVLAVTGMPVVRYSGIGTIVVKNSALGGLAIDLSTSQVLASTPPTGAACGYATPSSMPQTNLLAVVVAGPVTTLGGTTTCAQEQDLILVAGASPSDMLASLNKAQYYGIVFAESLNLAQNYEFCQVPNIWQNLPPPMQTLFGLSTPPVVIQQWRELMNCLPPAPIACDAHERAAAEPVVYQDPITRATPVAGGSSRPSTGARGTRTGSR
jgi:hypothetical protein